MGGIVTNKAAMHLKKNFSRLWPFLHPDECVLFETSLQKFGWSMPKLMLNN